LSFSAIFLSSISCLLSEFASFELSLGFAGESVLVKSGFADDCNPSNFEFSSFLTVFDMFLILGLKLPYLYEWE
jgi:hypothetical protein